MLQQLRLQLQFVIIEAGQCLGLIFGTNYWLIAVIEPLSGIQGCSSNFGQYNKPRAGPGELKSSAATVAVAVAVAVCLH